MTSLEKSTDLLSHCHRPNLTLLMSQSLPVQFLEFIKKQKSYFQFCVNVNSVNENICIYFWSLCSICFLLFTLGKLDNSVKNLIQFYQMVYVVGWGNCMMTCAQINSKSVHTGTLPLISGKKNVFSIFHSSFLSFDFPCLSEYLGGLVRSLGVTLFQPVIYPGQNCSLPYICGIFYCC